MPKERKHSEDRNSSAKKRRRGHSSSSSRSKSPKRDSHKGSLHVITISARKRDEKREEKREEKTTKREKSPLPTEKEHVLTRRMSQH